jgi:rare lipoprotein A
MPIFGLVWMASWVGCFFTSPSTRLLEIPTSLANVLTHPTLPIPGGLSGSLGATLSLNRFNSGANSHIVRSYLFNGIAPPASVLGSAALGQLPPVTFSQGNWLTTIANFFTPGPSVTQPVSVLTANQGGNVPGPRPKDPDNPLSYFVDAFQGALGGLQGVIARTQTIQPVVVMSVPATASRTQKGASPCIRALQVGTKPSPAERHQVWVQGCLVAELPNRNQAQAMAANLDKLLQTGQVMPERLHPTKVNGQPAGRMGDHILFTIDPTMAAQLDDTAEIAAVEWINNLRIALGQSPLTLVAAQVKMHHLYATGEAIGGMASWYGPYFHGRQTATGEIYDQEELTAAHPTLPFDTYLKVTNLKNGQSVVVRVNDRGPYFDNRILDISHRAARCIGSTDSGVVPIEATILAVDPTPDPKPVQTVAVRF